MWFSLFKWVNSTRYVQFFASLVVSLSISISGMMLTWPSPTIPLLTGAKEGLDFRLTTEETSWVVSGNSIGHAIGYLLVCYPANKYGRKLTFLLVTPLLFISWIGLLLSKKFILLFLFRIIGGIGVSAVTLLSSLYIAEIADKDLRGKLSSITIMLKLGGNLYVLSVGPFVSYYILTATCSVVPVIFFFCMTFLPESPYFLLKTGEGNKALNSLVQFSEKTATKQQIVDKFEQIKIGVERDMLNKTTLKELVCNKVHRKPLYILLGLKCLMQLSGAMAIESYMQTIISQSGSSISENTSSIIFGCVQILAALASTLLVDRVGRKPLLLYTAIGCGVCLSLEGIYFFLNDYMKADVSSISWLPTTGLALYHMFASLGIYSIPVVMLGELFATNVKENAAALTSFFGAVLSFGVTKGYSPLTESWGVYTGFWFFAAACFLGSIFIFYVVPETKNKSLKEIQDDMNHIIDKN